jgi:FtsP/CotA-like multicopper oxidase with cupredoxin domain
VLVLNTAGVGFAVHRDSDPEPVVTAAATSDGQGSLPGVLSDKAAPTGSDPAALPRGDGTVFAPMAEAPGGVKEFRLTAAAIDWEIEPGDVKPAFSFNGIIPGPTIRVNEGDRIRVIVRNNLPEPLVVHWHGMILPNAQDGVATVTQDAFPPGASYTYEYDAIAPGTHWYHSHIDGDQVGKGLYGSLEVVPRLGDHKVDRDYRLFVGDSNLGLIINGKSFPWTAVMPAKVGEVVRIRITPTGELSHPFHLHGQPFDLVAQDGFELAVPQTMDTLLVSTAQSFDIITKILVPGKWVFHCHIFSHMHKPGASHGKDGSMQGLVTVIDVAEPESPVPAPQILPPDGPKPPELPPTPMMLRR